MARASSGTGDRLRPNSSLAATFGSFGLAIGGSGCGLSVPLSWACAAAVVTNRSDKQSSDCCNRVMASIHRVRSSLSGLYKHGQFVDSASGCGGIRAGLCDMRAIAVAAILGCFFLLSPQNDARAQV